VSKLKLDAGMCRTYQLEEHVGWSVGYNNPYGQLDYKVVTKLKLPIEFLVRAALWDQHCRHLAYIAEQSLVDRARTETRSQPQPQFLSPSRVGFTFIGWRRFGAAMVTAFVVVVVAVILVYVDVVLVVAVD